MRAALLFVLSLVTCVYLPAQQTKDSQPLAKLYQEDQDARATLDSPSGPPKGFDFNAMARDDAQRRVKVHKLLDANEVKTATDYFHAALIYQHGNSPDEILLAHVLAMDAMSLGSKDARWLAAATLDRYLIRIWQPQAFGTQYSQQSYEREMRHDRMSVGLVSDSMRRALCVKPLAEQTEKSTGLTPCP